MTKRTSGKQLPGTQGKLTLQELVTFMRGKAQRQGWELEEQAAGSVAEILHPFINDRVETAVRDVMHDVVRHRMAHWAYRVVRTDARKNHEQVSVQLVFFEDEKPFSNVDAGDFLTDTSVDALRATLTEMLSCLDAPVISWARETPRRKVPAAQPQAGA